ncbi:hypothetical protein FVEN_g4009 [Fusarium venenatum]|uniref:uncharacterized protein n=1 Tax=Fusarium venenatum TaxID=56646 RepID=UPI001DCE4087|nr:hypothetical protein FVEN_g4009 [Fusarium venenatum]KAH6966002.1 hypothetical protein EDB82DRAFT_514511 [Fusarium venenatum]
MIPILNPFLLLTASIRPLLSRQRLSQGERHSDKPETFFIEIGNLGLDREPLRTKVTEVLTEPILRVLPYETKSLVLEWNLHYDLQMLNQITKFMDDDLEEWEYTVETPNRRKDMPWCGIGADILRFYVADLKPLRKGLPEDKRRTIVNNVRHGLSLFADFHDERVNAVEREAQAAIAGFVLREEAVSG